MNMHLAVCRGHEGLFRDGHNGFVSSPLLGRLVSLFLMIAVAVCSRGARAQCSDTLLEITGTRGTSGGLWASTVWDPDGPGPARDLLVVAGDFSDVGSIAASRLAAWDGERWAPVGPSFDGAVSALAVFRGELIASGAFTSNGGRAMAGIARWDGVEWQPLGAGLNDRAIAMREWRGDLFVGGYFTEAGGAPVDHIARWTGSLWTTLARGVDGPVLVMEEYRGELIVAGEFHDASGTVAHRIARWDSVLWRPLGPVGLSPEAVVNTLCVFENALIVGGRFGAAGGLLARHVASWNGSSWRAMGHLIEPSLGFGIQTLAAYEGELFIGGGFAISQEEPRNFARWAGDEWAVCAPPVNGGVGRLTSFRDRLMLIGWFTQVGEKLAARIAAWSDGELEPLGDGLCGPIYTVCEFEGDLIAGGRFPAESGAPSHIARWDGTRWSHVGQGLDQPVFATRVFRDQLIAGGYLAGSISAWNGAQWQPLGGGTNGRVFALMEYGGELIAAGGFTEAGGVAASNIAAWDGAGWRALGAGVEGFVAALAVYEGELIAGGDIDSAGGGPAENIAAWNGSTWRPLGHLDNTVTSLAVYGTDLVAGGHFRTADGAAARNVAAWDGAAWRPMGNPSGETDGGVDTLVTHGEYLIAGGTFTRFQGIAAARVVRWQGEEWQALAEPLPAGSAVVKALGHFRGDLVAGGGRAVGISLVAGNLFARWSADGRPRVAQEPRPLRVRPGETADLSAAAARGYRGVAYRWVRDGAVVSDGPGGASAGGGFVRGASGVLSDPTDGAEITLEIEGATQGDGGGYSVVFANDCGETASGTALLDVVCATDFNADGGIDGADVEAFFHVWEIADPSADLNGDGAVDGADVGVFFERWGGAEC